MSAKVVLLATRSEGKLRELKGILRDAGLEGITLDDAGIPHSAEEETIECYETFEENALAKARYFHRLSGMPAMADDSGLCVESLGGAPGVHSRRYSGRTDLTGQAVDDANNEKLQRDLAGAPNTMASYTCAAAFVDGPNEQVVMGRTHGWIISDPRGDNGFGYDPYFFSRELGMTFGEAGLDAKAEVSHRGRAFRALMAALRDRAGTL